MSTPPFVLRAQFLTTALEQQAVKLHNVKLAGDKIVSGGVIVGGHARRSYGLDFSVLNKSPFLEMIGDIFVGMLEESDREAAFSFPLNKPHLREAFVAKIKRTFSQNNTYLFNEEPSQNSLEGKKVVVCTDTLEGVWVENSIALLQKIGASSIKVIALFDPQDRHKKHSYFSQSQEIAARGITVRSYVNGWDLIGLPYFLGVNEPLLALGVYYNTFGAPDLENKYLHNKKAISSEDRDRLLTLCLTVEALKWTPCDGAPFTHLFSRLSTSGSAKNLVAGLMADVVCRLNRVDAICPLDKSRSSFSDIVESKLFSNGGTNVVSLQCNPIVNDAGVTEYQIENLPDGFRRRVVVIDSLPIESVELWRDRLHALQAKVDLIALITPFNPQKKGENDHFSPAQQLAAEFSCPVFSLIDLSDLKRHCPENLKVAFEAYEKVAKEPNLAQVNLLMGSNDVS